MPHSQSYPLQTKKNREIMRNCTSIPVSISLLLLFFFFLTTTQSTDDIINSTCKKCLTTSPTFNYYFCSTSLHSFPLNKTIDLQKLAIFAMELALTNTTNTISAIEKLINSGDSFDEFAIGCLNDCLGLYSDAVSTIQDSVEAFLLGEYDDANLKISAVMESAVTCQYGFGEKVGEVTPLTNENYGVYELSDIALCIINLVSLELPSSQSR